MDQIKLREFIETQFGELHSVEKEELLSACNFLQSLVNQKTINEETLVILKNAEDSIRILREKIVNRYINLLKASK